MAALADMTYFHLYMTVAKLLKVLCQVKMKYSEECYKQNRQGVIKFDR